MSQPDQLFCPIRKMWTAATPEEKVRQSLLHLMTTELAFPLGSIAVEKALSQMPHVSHSTGSVPTRRADILVYTNHLHPLLLVECKAIPLTPKVTRQVAGYNHFVRARFIAVANQTDLRMGWYDPEKQDYCFIKGLLPYADLIKI